MIDKAIILAAGQGKRMGTNIPKPLLPLDKNGTTFLDWHTRALERHGVKDIWIVGSPKTCGSKKNVSWVMNDHADSGSGYSAHLAFDRGLLDGRSRVVLMDADIVYDPSLFALLAERRGRSKTLVCGRHRDTAEEVLVYGDLTLVAFVGRPTRLSPSLSLPRRQKPRKTVFLRPQSPL